jgi:hypothetical protein
LSVVIFLINRNKAALPGCRLAAKSFMNLSLIPKSVRAPPNAPEAAPRATPTMGIKKIKPTRRPQRLPDAAPAAVVEKI